uniref:Uncharacterized protein n=1 Tax=Aegilops tauschii subsp. strangulata TaxID=200361 RepID=A0A453JPH2_AEGTS
MQSSETNVLGKLQPQSTWYLTGLGSLATTQREYVVLHAFPHLNVQVILSQVQQMRWQRSGGGNIKGGGSFLPGDDEEGTMRKQQR